MSAQSVSQEFIDLATELFEDGAEGFLTTETSAPVYDPATLTSSSAKSDPIPTKIVFVAPNLSTQIEFEQEVKNEDYSEHKVALSDYRGEVKMGTVLEVTGVGKFVVTGKVAINSLGITIFHRLKVSR